MAFNEIPSNLRTPFVAVEITNENAITGSQAQPYEALFMGTQDGGSATNDTLVSSITTADQAGVLFGNGSVLQQSIEAYRDVDTLTPLSAIVSANVGEAAATGTITLTGSPTENGTLYFYIGGRRYAVVVEEADTATEMGDAVAAAINDDVYAICSAANVAGVVTLTAVTGWGLIGNDLKVTTEYRDDEINVPGATIVIVEFASGAGEPAVATVVGLMDDTHYNGMHCPYTSSSFLDGIRAELESRNGPLRQLEGMAFTAKSDTFGNLTTLGESRNDRFLTIIESQGPDNSVRKSAQYMSRVLQSSQIDPARPYQTLSLPTILPPKRAFAFSLEERNMLLYSGIATSKSDSGQVRIERGITTYRTNPGGAEDPSYLDVNTFYTLSFMRWDFRTSFVLKYPRHKLSDDGQVYAAGQKVMTPNVGRTFAVNKFTEWSFNALAENIDQFKEDLVVQRNTQDRNRLDFFIAPDLVNQMRVAGVQLAFLL